MNTFGERLLHLRKAHKLTQRELAQLLFVSQTCINHYERGHDEPSHQKLIHLAQILGTITDFLLGLTDREQVPTTPDAFLTPAEWELIEQFRQLPLSWQERALGYLQGAAENKS